MRIEFLPAAIAPEGFQAHQGFVPRRDPELAGAFETALVLTARRFNGPGTDGAVSELGQHSSGPGRLGTTGSARSCLQKRSRMSRIGEDDARGWKGVKSL